MNATPKRWSDLEKWISGSMLGNRKVTLTISGIEMVEVHPRQGQIAQAPALAFRETPKRLILSPTNCRMLRALFGDDVNGCIGQRVTLESVPMKVAGRDTLPVRISQAAPGGKSAAPAPGTVDAATGEIGEDDVAPEPAGEDAAPAPAPATSPTPAPTIVAATPTPGLDAHFGPNPRQAQTPAPDANAARAQFYKIASAAMGSKKITAQGISDLVHAANGDGFVAALAALEKRLAA